jgi:ABC-type Fe3+-siderophore transport system permease subunit
MSERELNNASIKSERRAVTKNERRLAQMTVALLGASILMFSVWLSSGYAKYKLPIYLGIVGAILIFWLTGMVWLRRSHRN